MALPSFSSDHGGERLALSAMIAALQKVTAARHRLQLAQARSDTRAWVVKRRERTRQLIELGGLVAKAGLIELAEDDRALLYGAFLDIAARLRSENAEQAKLLWRRRGRRAFRESDGD